MSSKIVAPPRDLVQMFADSAKCVSSCKNDVNYIKIDLQTATLIVVERPDLMLGHNVPRPLRSVTKCGIFEI